MIMIETSYNVCVVDGMENFLQPPTHSEDGRSMTTVNPALG